MKKILFITLIIAFFAHAANAQQGAFGWRIGIGGGYTNYYGDLSSYNINAKEIKSLKNISNLWHQNLTLDNLKDINTKSFFVSAERKLNNTIGLQLQYSKVILSGNDRTDFKGELSPNNTNYARSLNFKTNINDLGLGLVFKTDNDRFLGNNALIAPYFILSVGALNYNVFADLKNADSSNYNYANITVQDGNYETEVTNLATESNKSIKTEFYAGLGLGVKLKLSRRFNLNIQTDYRYTTTDYLDDASKTFPTFSQLNETSNASKPNPAYKGTRGRNNGVNDMFAFTSVSIRYNFGKKKHSFKAPVLYAEKDRSAAPTITINTISSAPTTLTQSAIEETKPTLPSIQQQVEQIPKIILQPEGIVRLQNPTLPTIISPYAPKQIQIIEKRIESRKDTIVNINVNYNYGYNTQANQLTPTQPQPLYMAPSAPSKDNSAEIEQLKRELESLKMMLRTPPQSNNSPAYVPPKSDDKIIYVNPTNNSNSDVLTLQKQLSEMNTKMDALKSTPAPTTTVIDNTLQVTELQKQIALMNDQITALRKEPKVIPTNNAPITINTTSYNDEIRNIPPTSLYFVSGSATLSPIEKEKLYQVIAIYQKYPNIAKVSIKGYTDAQGSPDKNMVLSQNRSNNVRDLLINNYGINQSDIVVNYFGQQNNNSNKAGNPYGRRVDVEFVK